MDIDKREIAELIIAVKNRGLKTHSRKTVYNLSQKDANKVAFFESLEGSHTISGHQIQQYKDIQKEVRREHMQDHISKTRGKHNLDPQVWDKICKIRQSPIETIKDVHIGEMNKPHILLPTGTLGYIIHHPEVFFLSPEDLINIKYCIPNYVPVCIKGHSEIVFLQTNEYKIVAPFFDMHLASCIEMEVEYACA